MCSNTGDIEDLSNCTKDLQRSVNKKSLQRCKKCTEKSIILLQKKDPFCMSCFFEYCNHKFRSTIGKSKKVKHGEKVLLAYSGGRKSAALLHMTCETLKSASLKQISFTPGILYIDENFILPQASAASRSSTTFIIKQLKETNYPIFYSSLEMVYKINGFEDLYFSISNEFTPDVSSVHQELKDKMNENFKDLQLSAKMDLLKHLRLLLITEIASQIGYDYVFVGDSASSLAVDLLSDIALGRGSQISCDTEFYDTRYKVPVCRPLREFLNKEIVLYNHLHCTQYHVFPDFLTKTSPNSSIQRLTETFLSNLQENFPATIFTVFRTGGKLSKNNVSVVDRTCIICKSELDNANPDSCSALKALKISQKLSSHTDALKNSSDTKDIMEFLCHGCSVTFHNMTKAADFQLLISEASCVRMERCKMKEQIKEFLLEDNSDCS